MIMEHRPEPGVVVLSAPIPTRLLSAQFADGHTSPTGDVAAMWQWRSDDPYVVLLHIAPSEVELLTGPIVWTLGRELLTTGLTGPAGIGDVQVLPYQRRLHLVFTSADGTARLDAGLRQVAWFLSATYRWVPAGAEPRHIDWDQVIADLLSAEGRL